MEIDLTKIRRVWFTARQLALITQLAQAIGVLLAAGGVITEEKWATLSGALISILTIAITFRDGTANDTNTAIAQQALGSDPDAKPGPKTVSDAVITYALSTSPKE